MVSKKDPLAPYDYAFPASLIAQAPAHPRDSAKLAVFSPKTGKTSWDAFSNIGAYLPKNAVLVLNDTKVIPARLTLKKPTGGNVDVLCIERKRGSIVVLANKRLADGMRLALDRTKYCTVIKREGRGWVLRPSFPLSQLDGILQRSGHTPLPPYIKHTPLTESQLRREYQSVWAERSGSVAAPTASLHFTKTLLKKLERSGMTILRVTLHVNLGTFAPVTDDHLAKGRLHSETYVIDPKTARSIEQAKRGGRPIIAVGTTVVRTLESAADAKGRLKLLSGSTDLFIREGYKFRLVAGLITNFHVPRSSLLMLVSALVGRKRLMDLYAKAIRRKFRLFSFGDAMLVLPSDRDT